VKVNSAIAMLAKRVRMIPRVCGNLVVQTT
jgi:hypothetical protein